VELNGLAVPKKFDMRRVCVRTIVLRVDVGKGIALLLIVAHALHAINIYYQVLIL
jgi:hypothetical protein